MPNRDRVIIGLLALFIVVALTQGLHFVLFADEMVLRVPFDPLAAAAEIYGQADARYFDQVNEGSLAFATLNLVPTQLLNALVIFAIVRGRRFRYPLQLVVGAYMSYSVLFYFWQEHLGNYTHMNDQTLSNFALFYGCNLPWLLGYAFMLWDAWRFIDQRVDRRPRN